MAAATLARDDPQTDLSCFDWLSAVDELDAGFDVVLSVYSATHRHRALLRTRVPRSAPRLDSLVPVFAGADWHERETHEMFGIEFTGHPGLAPLLLPPGFQGHPLRKEFVLAARATGVRPAKIVIRHLIPNTVGPVIVYATLTVPSVMLSEAFLSFLGLGVQAPLASWGSLAADGIQNIAVFPWQLICPGVTMALTLFSLNFIGDGLRDALDPTMRKQ